VDEWLTGIRGAVAAAAGIDAAELTVDAEDVDTLLDLARIAAHDTGKQTNAPILCYLVGRFLVGRAHRGVELDELAATVRRARPEGDRIADMRS
jgi:hypothetical protein